MPTFSSKPIARKGSSGWSPVAQLTPKVRRHPVLLFGVPFVLTIVAGSFGLSYLTQTRYDYNASKVQTISKQDELGMRKDRRKVDIREEYFVSRTALLVRDGRIDADILTATATAGKGRRIGQLGAQKDRETSWRTRMGRTTDRSIRQRTSGRGSTTWTVGPFYHSWQQDWQTSSHSRPRWQAMPSLQLKAGFFCCYEELTGEE
jgi:hypothetical protein